MKGNRALFLVVAAMLSVHCGSGTPSGGPAESTGSISLRITTVPSGVQCIQINVLGSSLVTESFSVTAGSSSANLSLGQLPLGQVTVNGQAFSSACTAISGQTATWIADPDIVTLQAGVVSNLALTFRPNNPVGGSATFVGNVTSIGMGTQQLGIVFSDGSVRAAGQVPGFTTNPASFVTLSSLTNVVQFAPSTPPSQFQSNAFDCVLLGSGAVQCWGDNTFGQLGNGTNTASNTPVTVSGLPSNVVQIAVGQGHVCALTSATGAFVNASLYCWGRNDHGQLGLSNTTNVNTAHGVENGGIAFVAAGAYETCTSGASCFGQNSNGQIGNNSTTDATGPFSGAYIAAAPTVAVGEAHACAVRQDGTLFCWGANGSGQLGLGNTTEQHVATAVTALSNTVVQVAASLNTTCARRNDGSVWCWGDGSLGAVGDGTGIQQTSPVQAVGLPPSSALYGGGGAFCSVSKNQTVWCWGSNQGLQLATGMILNVYVPTQLSL
jgi:hypothetical protein